MYLEEDLAAMAGTLDKANRDFLKEKLTELKFSITMSLEKILKNKDSQHK